MAVIHGYRRSFYDIYHTHARTILLVAFSSYWLRYGMQLANDSVVVLDIYRMDPQVYDIALWRNQGLSKVSFIFFRDGTWRIPIRWDMAYNRLHRWQKRTPNILILNRPKTVNTSSSMNWDMILSYMILASLPSLSINLSPA
jgi:hypothetical protein